MNDDSSEEEKQNFLRENILDKGYDPNIFVDFLIGKKGEDGADVGNWSMRDLQIVVNEFISMQSNAYNSPQGQSNMDNNINNNPLQNTVKNDPLANPVPTPQHQQYNDPLQAQKPKFNNDPLQSTQHQKKKTVKYDPLSGSIPQEEEPPQKKQNSSMASFFSNNANQNKNNNVTPQIQIQPQVMPQMQPQMMPQMQNQFPPQFFNQIPNFQNPLMQNQFNPQFQPQMMQGQFPQLIIPNQQQNIVPNPINNATQKNTQEVKPQIPQQPQPPKNEPIKQNQEAENKNQPSSQNQNKNPLPNKPQPEPPKSDGKDDMGIAYGIIYSPTEECKFVDKTPLGISDSPYMQVGFPEKVEGGFFSKSYVTYLITTFPLNIKVRRRYSDFQWLRQIMSNLYIGCVIPTIPRKNKIGSDKFGDAFLQKRMRTLEKFLNHLLMNPMIKYSQLFYDFISIENEADFNKKKKEYDKMKPPQNINENQSFSGRANVDVKKEKETFFENIKDNISYNETLFTKLNENFKLLKVQIENISLKIDEIAQNWNELYKTSTKYFDGDDISQTYDHMCKLFTNWSDTIKRHCNVIHIDIREYFKYVKNNFKSMKDLVSIVETNKNTFNKNERYLINKKEDLFRKGDVNKWELCLEDRDKANALLQDKNAALKKIIPRETNNVIAMKKVYGYYLNRIIEEYERLKIINSVLHRKNTVIICDKIAEIYGDYQKSITDIINSVVSKDKNIRSIINVNL
jgi:sorting nexin-7/30/sorting nexin-8